MNCFCFTDGKIDMENHLSSFCYRDNNMFENANNSAINRSFNGKDLNSSRKRGFCSAPKPDTPPVSNIFILFIF